MFDMSLNPAQRLIEYGQSVWYDNISREIINNGELDRLIREWGVRGITSNPTIFDNAISSSSVHDDTIVKLGKSGESIDNIFEEIAIADIASAADLLRRTYDESGGNDGFVSIEVSPLLARDTKATIEQAQRLNARLNRPNIMIKVPGTKEGIPAIRNLLEQGINVNVTLLFSVENYVEVAKTYCEALRSRVAKGLPVDRIRSVASFFVSRVDASVDKELEALINKSDSSTKAAATELLGKFGIANSKLAYEKYQQIFETDSFSDLKGKKAEAQRPLWASTGVKNPAYRDVLYVEELIGQNTINTMPHATLKAFVDHGKPRDALAEGVSDAQRIASMLEKLGIDLAGIMVNLQEDGVKKFTDSFVALNKAIQSKLASK